VVSCCLSPAAVDGFGALLKPLPARPSVIASQLAHVPRVLVEGVGLAYAPLLLGRRLNAPHSNQTQGLAVRRPFCIPTTENCQTFPHSISKANLRHARLHRSSKRPCFVRGIDPSPAPLARQSTARCYVWARRCTMRWGRDPPPSTSVARSEITAPLELAVSVATTCFLPSPGGHMSNETSQPDRRSAQWRLRRFPRASLCPFNQGAVAGRCCCPRRAAGRSCGEPSAWLSLPCFLAVLVLRAAACQVEGSRRPRGLHHWPTLTILLARLIREPCVMRPCRCNAVRLTTRRRDCACLSRPTTHETARFLILALTRVLVVPPGNPKNEAATVTTRCCHTSGRRRGGNMTAEDRPSARPAQARGRPSCWLIQGAAVVPGRACLLITTGLS